MSFQLTDRRPLGATSLEIPPFGFGAAHLGGMYNRVSSETAHATLKAAWDSGVRLFDTAPFYGRGLSEHRVGDFLIDQPRDQFVLTTKVGRYFRRPDDPRNFDRTPWGGGLNMEIVWDYSYDGIMRSYEQSLLRLGLDTIDALLIHDPEAAQNEGGPRLEDLFDSGMKALEELKRNGHIKAIGMGLNASETLDTTARRIPLDFCVVAMPYTLLDQVALPSGMRYCLDNNISVIVGAPYASGILATGPGPKARYRYQIAEPDIQEKTRRIQLVCTHFGVSLQAAALQFPLGHPAVVSVIPGGASPTEVNSNVVFLREQIPDQMWDELRAQALIDLDAPVPA
ncbi:aldo/keto reductase [Devosia rhodophyticola]|uniref:Aldo/keto reductase n=1 Tax=Devosia rhodophyticola TaxID=3026423 RepID=A0ABY7YZZ9_9HYPH|nr:aldo/keto reductase [Devosia rhodophyticola]WDR06847.1 aldo/keto reductase [Devosia rhodophyticola]